MYSDICSEICLGLFGYFNIAMENHHFLHVKLPCWVYSASKVTREIAVFSPKTIYYGDVGQ